MGVLTFVNTTKTIHNFAGRYSLSVKKMQALWKCIHWLHIVWKRHEMCERYGHKRPMLW